MTVCETFEEVLLDDYDIEALWPPPNDAPRYMCVEEYTESAPSYTNEQLQEESENWSPERFKHIKRYWIIESNPVGQFWGTLNAGKVSIH